MSEHQNTSEPNTQDVCPWLAIQRNLYNCHYGAQGDVSPLGSSMDAYFAMRAEGIEHDVARLLL